MNFNLPSNPSDDVLEEVFTHAKEYFKKFFSGNVFKKDIQSFNFTVLKIGGILYAITDQPIGNGGFGEVYLARDEKGNFFAIKKENKSEIKNNDKQLAIMQSLARAPKNAKTEHDDDFEYVVYTVMRLEKGEDLFKLSAEGDYQKLPYAQKLTIALKAAYDLNLLHGERIIHADIKPHNFVANIYADKLGFEVDTYAVDFDQSMKLANNTDVIKTSANFLGTWEFAAPEIKKKYTMVEVKQEEVTRERWERIEPYLIDHKYAPVENNDDPYSNYSFASDIYALGITFRDFLKLNDNICNPMLDDLPEKRPASLSVIHNLVTELKKQPLDELDIKAIELIAICENHINTTISEENKKLNTPKPLISPTFKELKIQEIIDEFKKDFLNTEKLNTQDKKLLEFLGNKEVDADKKAIVIMGYLSKHKNNYDANVIDKTLTKIEKISRKAKFIIGPVNDNEPFEKFRQKLKSKTWEEKEKYFFKHIDELPQTPSNIRDFSKTEAFYESVVNSDPNENTNRIIKIFLEEFKPYLFKNIERLLNSQQYSTNEKLALLKGYILKNQKSLSKDKTASILKKVQKASKISGNFLGDLGCIQVYEQIKINFDLEELFKKLQPQLNTIKHSLDLILADKKLSPKEKAIMLKGYLLKNKGNSFFPKNQEQKLIRKTLVELNKVSKEIKDTPNKKCIEAYENEVVRLETNKKAKEIINTFLENFTIDANKQEHVDLSIFLRDENKNSIQKVIVLKGYLLKNIPKNSSNETLEKINDVFLEKEFDDKMCSDFYVKGSWKPPVLFSKNAKHLALHTREEIPKTRSEIKNVNKKQDPHIQ